MLLLGNLMETWLSLLQEQRLSSSSLSTGKGGSSQEQQQATRVSKGESAQLSLRASKGESAGSAAAVANSLILDVHRLEGVLFMLLCSYDEAVRCDAESLLGLLRTLHQQLGDMAQQLGLTSLPHISNQAAAGGGGIGGAGSSSFGSSVSAQDEKSAHQAGSGGSGTGGGMFSRHKPAMSKDSLEFMATLGEHGSHLSVSVGLSGSTAEMWQSGNRSCRPPNTTLLSALSLKGLLKAGCVQHLGLIPCYVLPAQYSVVQQSFMLVVCILQVSWRHLKRA